MSKNRKRMIISEKIARISTRVLIYIYIAYIFFVISFFISGIIIKEIDCSMLDIIKNIVAIITLASLSIALYTIIPYFIILFICMFIMIFNKKKILLKRDEFTEVHVNIKENKKTKLKDKIFIDICNSKNVKIFAKPEGIDQILLKGLKYEEEIFEILVYEDEFYYNKMFEYE